MIDTIKISVPQEHFHIQKPELFKPNANELKYMKFIQGQAYVKCIQNASKQDQENKIYKPKLTLYKRKPRVAGSGIFPISLTIELSLPKLMYGNNFDELTDNDFEKVAETLQFKLGIEMGVIIPRERLKNANAQDVHYGKNIVFIDYTAISSVLRHIGKVKFTKRFKLNTSRYENGGEAVRFHTNSYQILFYDKLAELRNNQKIAIEKEDREFNPQLKLFDEYRKEEKKAFEALRIEIRLIGKQKIKHLFKKLGIPIENDEITFKNLYSQAISQKILIDHFEDIFDAMMPEITKDNKQIDLFAKIAKTKPTPTPLKNLAIIGFASILNESGYIETRNEFEQHYNYRSMTRLYNELKQFNLETADTLQSMQKIRKDLQEYKPLKLIDFNIKC